LSLASFIAAIDAKHYTIPGLNIQSHLKLMLKYLDCG
jgi:hypothetical protein